MGSSALAQLISIIGITLAARIYSPIAFAEYGIYIGYLTILSTFSTLRLEVAILKYDTNEDLRNITQLAFIILISYCFVVYFIFSLINVDELDSFFLTIGIFFYSIQQFITNLFSSIEKYKRIGFVRIVNSSIFFLIIFILYIKENNNLNIIMIHISSYIISSLLCLFLLDIKLFSSKLKNVKKYLYENKSYFTIDTLSSMTNTLARQIPSVILPGIVGKEIAGYYFFCQRIIAAPINLLGNSVGNIFRKTAINEFKKLNNFKRVYVYTLKRLIAASVLVLSFSQLITYDLFVDIFDEKWSEAYQFFNIILILYLFKLSVSPLTFSFYVVDKLHLNLIGQILFFIFLICPIYISHIFNLEPFYIIANHVISGSIAYILYGLVSYNISKCTK